MKRKEENNKIKSHFIAQRLLYIRAKCDRRVHATHETNCYTIEKMELLQSSMYFTRFLSKCIQN